VVETKPTRTTKAREEAAPKVVATMTESVETAVTVVVIAEIADKRIARAVATMTAIVKRGVRDAEMKTAMAAMVTAIANVVTKAVVAQRSVIELFP